MHIGPLALLAWDPVWASQLDEFYFTPDNDGGYPAIKYVTVVSEDAVGPVVLSIDEGPQRTAGLVYDLDRQPRMPVAATDRSVAFQGCAGSDTQFNGGILVTQPTCLRLTVTDEGAPNRESARWTASIPLGVPVNECP